MKVTSRLHVNHALFVLLGFVGLGNAFIPMNNHGGPRTHTRSSRGTSIQMGLRDRLSKTANMVPRISEKLIASVAELAEIAGEGGPVDIPDGVSAASAFDAAMVAEERANRGPVRLLSKENSFNLFSTFFFGVVLYGAQARYFKMAKKSVKDFGYQAVRVKNNKPKIQQLLKKTKARVGPYFWRDKMWARYCSAFLLSRPLEPTVFDTFAYTASLFRGPRRSNNRLATLALTAGTRFPNDKDRLTLLYLLVTRTFPDEEEVIEPLKTEMARIYAKMLKTEDQQEGLVEFYTKTQRWLENIYMEIVEKNGPQILNLKEKPSEWRALGLKEDVAQRIYMRYMRAEIQALIDRETAALDDQAAEEAKAKGTAIRYQDYYAVPKDDGLDEETRKERQINAEDDIEPDEIWEEEVLPPLQAHMSSYEQVMAEEERQKEAERKVMEMKIKKEEEVPMEAVDAHNFEINTQPLEEEEEEYYLEKGAFNDFEKEEEEEKEEEDPFKMIVVPKKEGLETLYKHVYKDFDGVDVTVDPATIDYLQKLYSASPDANASAEAGAAAPAAPAAPVAAAVAEPPAAAAAAAAPFTVTPPAPPAPPAPEATATLVTPPPAAAPAAAAPPAEQLQPGTQPVAHECENCGYMLFVAPGREEVFFGDDFKCPSCGSEKDQFKTVEME